MIKLKHIVNESKYAFDVELYHYTSIASTFKILLNNELKTRYHYHKSLHNGVINEFSFSRSTYWLRMKKFKIGGVKIESAIAVDANKLSNKYILKPYADTGFIKNSRYFEYEEKLIIKTKNNEEPNSIPNFNTYVKYVVIKKYPINIINKIKFANILHYYLRYYDNKQEEIDKIYPIAIKELKELYEGEYEDMYDDKLYTSNSKYNGSKYGVEDLGANSSDLYQFPHTKTKPYIDYLTEIKNYTREDIIKEAFNLQFPLIPIKFV